jgi:hypothetical protein
MGYIVVDCCPIVVVHAAHVLGHLLADDGNILLQTLVERVDHHPEVDE